MSSLLSSRDGTPDLIIRHESQFLQSPKTPPSAAGNDFTPGFGFEFETRLKQRLEDHAGKQEARYERYGRFGVDREDVRLNTPPHMREAYLQLVEEDLNDVHTPTPSASPSPPSPRISPQIDHKPKPRKSGSASQPKRDRTLALGINKRLRLARYRQQLPSTHKMTTRSRSRAAQFQNALVHTLTRAHLAYVANSK